MGRAEVIPGAKWEAGKPWGSGSQEKQTGNVAPESTQPHGGFGIHAGGEDSPALKGGLRTERSPGSLPDPVP